MMPSLASDFSFISALIAFVLAILNIMVLRALLTVFLLNRTPVRKSNGTRETTPPTISPQKTKNNGPVPKCVYPEKVARYLLNKYYCRVHLSIALGDYFTTSEINDKDQVYIEKMGLTHIHNISEIRGELGYLPVEWDKSAD